VTQVEEVKCILRLVPIWLCSILYSTAYSQMSSIFIEQAAAMDDSFLKFNIPPAGISVFEIVGVTAFVFIYEFCIVRLCSKIMSREPPTELQRMGVGLVISTAAMLTSGLVEQQRLKYRTSSSSSLSILWQIPQYVLIGASEVFMYVTMTEFFNHELPEGLRSLGSALSVASMAAGNYANSLIVTLVMTITCKGNNQAAGWIPEDLNRGHVDWFFFVIAALNAMDLLVFLVLAKRYRRAPTPTLVQN
jgi:peptide/histidine transporter 3/4